MNQLRIQFPFFKIQDSVNQLVIQQELYLWFRIQWISSEFSFLFLRISSWFSKHSAQDSARTLFKIQDSVNQQPQDSVPFFKDSGFSESARDSARTLFKIQDSVNQLRIQFPFFLRFRIQWISSWFSKHSAQDSARTLFKIQDSVSQLRIQFPFLRFRIQWISSGFSSLSFKNQDSVNQLRIQQELLLKFRIQWISSGFRKN